MRTKYADLIKQLECVTDVCNQVVQATKKVNTVIDGLDDILGVRGSVFYMDHYDIDRAIHIRSSCFAEVAIDCGTCLKMKHLGDYTRFECSMFGYPVFALFQEDEQGYVDLLKKVEAIHNQAKGNNNEKNESKIT